MIVQDRFLIPIINREIRDGMKEFSIYEGWRDEEPLFKGIYNGRCFVTSSIGHSGYRSLFPKDREIPSYYDLIQKVLHGSCIMERTDIEGYLHRFHEIVKDEEPFRRNTRFYYDTNSLMNNYFHIFRENIPDLIRAASHTTSYGVVSELEDLFDRKLKGHYFPDDFREIYDREEEMFYNQPNLVGRFARMGYPEIDYMRDTLRSDILTDDRTGDRGIMSAFVHDMQKNNVEGVIVTNDSTMAERAEKRMGVWHVKFDLEPVKDVVTKMEYFLDAIYRAAITYGRVRINENIIIDGIWKGKGAEDWGSRNISLKRCNECDIGKIRRILKEIPDEFQGKGYYS